MLFEFILVLQWLATLKSLQLINYAGVQSYWVFKIKYNKNNSKSRNSYIIVVQRTKYQYIGQFRIHILLLKTNVEEHTDSPL